MARAGDVFHIATPVIVNTIGCQFQHPIGQRGQKVPVMRDKEHRPLILRQRCNQHFLCRHVEVVRRLVQHKKIGRVEKAFSP